MMKTVIVLGLSFSSGLAWASPTDVLVLPEPGSVRLEGRAGLSADRCLNARAYSDWARGDMYEECVNSFRTHWDDSDGHAGWQNEYWGKTMLCFAGAIAYTGDAALANWVKAKLSPRPTKAVDAGVPQVWDLTLFRGIESKTVPVSDFASVSNVDDPENWFSLWF